MTADPVKLLEGKHMISTLLFIDGNDGCMKTDLYRAVSTNPRMPEKLDTLEAAGLLVQDSSGNANTVRLYITESGRKVAAMLRSIDDAIKENH